MTDSEKLEIIVKVIKSYIELIEVENKYLDYHLQKLLAHKFQTLLEDLSL